MIIWKQGPLNFTKSVSRIMATARVTSMEAQESQKSYDAYKTNQN